LPIARDVAFPHDLSPTIDHVMPRALGGAHEFDNVQTAHLRCNVIKHASVDPQMRLV
jgi:5-methylcytosine-specific restriction endonuclease McrA